MNSEPSNPAPQDMGYLGTQIDKIQDFPLGVSQNEEDGSNNPQSSSSNSRPQQLGAGHLSSIEDSVQNQRELQSPSVQELRFENSEQKYTRSQQNIHDYDEADQGERIQQQVDGQEQAQQRGHQEREDESDNEVERLNAEEIMSADNQQDCQDDNQAPFSQQYHPQGQQYSQHHSQHQKDEQMDQLEINQYKQNIQVSGQEYTFYYQQKDNQKYYQNFGIQRQDFETNYDRHRHMNQYEDEDNAQYKEELVQYRRQPPGDEKTSQTQLHQVADKKQTVVSQPLVEPIKQQKTQMRPDTHLTNQKVQRLPNKQFMSSAQINKPKKSQKANQGKVAKYQQNPKKSEQITEEMEEGKKKKKKNKKLKDQSQIKVHVTKEGDSKGPAKGRNDLSTIEIEEDIRMEEMVERTQKVDKKPPNISSQNIPMQNVPVQIIVAPNIPAAVILPSMIVKQAEKERIGSIHRIFEQYVTKHSKYLGNHQIVLTNIMAECEKRWRLKLVTSYMIRDYFAHLASISKDFHGKSYKFSKEQFKSTQSQNPFINLRVDLRPGVDELDYIRKAMGNDFLKFNQFLTETIITNIQLVFDNHSNRIFQARRKLDQQYRVYEEIEKQFRKRVSKVNKVYTKGEQGIEQTDDVFVEMARFVKIEKDLRQALANWGASLVQFRKSYVEVQQTVFEEVQRIFNEYKNYTRTLYRDKGILPFDKIVRMQDQVRQQYKFNKLCVITNCDYISYVFQLNQKGKEKKQLTNKDFERFFTVQYFQRYTGDAASLLKGTTSKAYDLKKEHCVLVNTISGNLIQFNKATVELEEKFSAKNISAKIVSEGVVEVNETVRKFIFSSQRTIRVVFKDTDRAEELIAFLNEQNKEEQPIQ